MNSLDGKGQNNNNAQRQKRGKAASNYRPATCLPLVWKLLAGVCGEEVYGFLDTNLLLLHEQKECRRKSTGTNGLLLLIRL